MCSSSENQYDFIKHLDLNLQYSSALLIAVDFSLEGGISPNEMWLYTIENVTEAQYSNFFSFCHTGIVDYMIEQAGPPSKQIQATKQVQEFLKDGDDVIIIGVFSGETDKSYQLYQEAGKLHFKNIKLT